MANKPIRTLKMALLEDKHELAKRKQVAYEIHYRMPRRLGKAFQASHFTLIRRSPEDWNYEFCMDRTLEIFSREKNSEIREVVFPEFGIKQDDSREQIGAAYDNILEQETALFVFGAYERIIDLTSRKVIDENGKDRALIDEIISWSHRFRNFSRAVTKFEAPERHAAQSGYKLSEDLGSSRHWLEANHRDGNEEWPFVEQILSDFRHMRLRKIFDEAIPKSQEVLSNFEYYLRWSRSPQTWNYTFIESLKGNGNIESPYFFSIRDLLCACAVEPSILAARAFSDVPANRDFPGYLLAGAHYLLIPVDMLIALSVTPPSLLGLNDPSDVIGILGGIRRGGDQDSQLKAANRFLDKMRGAIDLSNRKQEVAHLLNICLRIHTQPGTLAIFEKHWSTGITDAAENALKTLISGELTKLFDGQRKTNHNDTLQFLNFISENKSFIAYPGVYKFLGNLVKEVIIDPHHTAADKETVLRQVAEVTRSFWEFAIAPNLSSEHPEIQTPRTSSITGTAQATAQSTESSSFSKDFVCSSMIEGRCLYFSNFIPEGDDLFTRTLFVDLGMRDIQSARVLQRLADILTYRSIPIRHLERVNAAIEALLELNLDLNEIEGGDRVKDPLVIEKRLDKTLDVSRSMARLNGFITYGIAGQWSSSEAYLNQIMERCEDLREKRIEGYAQLTDFVKRRLAHSVRFVERMSRHQITVARRITELMDRIRTELDSYRTKGIAGALDAQLEAMEKLTATSESLMSVSSQMEDNLGLQTSLLKNAEALILIGSTYYLFSLLSYFGHPVDVIESVSDITPSKGMNIAITLVLMLAVLTLSVLFMKVWPKFDAIIGDAIRARRARRNSIKD